MGYGKRALKLLKSYYSGNFTSLDEDEAEEDSDDNGKSVDSFIHVHLFISKHKTI